MQLSKDTVEFLSEVGDYEATVILYYTDICSAESPAEYHTKNQSNLDWFILDKKPA